MDRRSDSLSAARRGRPASRAGLPAAARRGTAVVIGAALAVGLGAGLLLCSSLLPDRAFDDPADADLARVGPGAEREAHGVPSRALLAAPTASSQAPSVPAPVPAAPGPAMGRAVPVVVTLPQTLQVGDLGELLVALGPSAGVGEIAFTLQSDANVLQVRAATEGEGAAGAGGGSRFSVDIAPGEDRVRIRSGVSASAPLAAGVAGMVALVQVQAVAPGATTLVISELTVQGTDGRPLPAVLPSSTLRLLVPFHPPQPPDPGAPPHGAGAAALQTPAEAVEEGD